MRPKVVLLILVVAFALMGAVVMLKGLTTKHAGETGGQASVSNSPMNALSASTNGGTSSAVINSTALSPEARAAVISKEIEQIQELQSEVDGTNNPIIISALLLKVDHPEPEVRQAALLALRELNDTNAIPGLEKALANVQDPRGKVAIMDVVDFLKLPGITDDVPPELQTNRMDGGPIPSDLKMNPKFMHQQSHNGKASANKGQKPPANTPATQPQ